MKSVIPAEPTRPLDQHSPFLKLAATAARCTLMARPLLGTGAAVVAIVVLWHTFTFLMAHRPVLPTFDGWAPWTSLNEVLERRTTPLKALIAPHNEHRILLTRLLFLIDLLDSGRDRISTVASIAFQVLHAGIWLFLLRQVGGDRPVRWLVGSTIVAMLFTLRQGENFISGFQAQFTGVFALDVLVAVLLVPRSLGQVGQEMPSSCRLSLGTLGLIVLPFVMANGLLAGPAVAATGLVSRSLAGRRLACFALITTLFSIVLDLSLPSDGVTSHLALTPTALLHAAAYIGGTVTSGRLPWAITAGFLGLSSTVLALGVVLCRGFRCSADGVAMQAMLFSAGSACATAAGRIGAGFGVEQALSGRYDTGSAAFWSATLVFWVVRCRAMERVRQKRDGLRILTALAVTLLVFVLRDQHSYDRVIAEQSAATVRVKIDLEGGAPPAISDLARIGVTMPTAKTVTTLMRLIHGAPQP